MRALGGSVGQAIYPTRKSAPGIFRMDDVEALIAQDRWPTPQNPNFASVALQFGPNPVLATAAPLDRSNYNNPISYTEATAGAGAGIMVAATGGPFVPQTSCFRLLGTGGVFADMTLVPAIGTQNFCLEGWWYFNGFQTVNFIDYRSNSGGTEFVPLMYELAAGDIFYYVHGANIATIPAGTFLANTWNHLAYWRIGTTGRIAANGVIANTVTDSTTYIATTSARYMQGNTGGGTGMGFGDRMGEQRLTIGTGVYGTTNFTPQMTAFYDY